MNIDIAHAELQAAKRAELHADARYTTALYDLEQAAAQRMPADTLTRRVAKVTGCELELRVASERVGLLNTIIDAA